MNVRKVTEEAVLQIRDGQPGVGKYLRVIDGNWDPGYLPTEDVWEALRFPDVATARHFVKTVLPRTGWLVSITRVRVAVELDWEPRFASSA